jgi:hypothetical protein
MLITSTAKLPMTVLLCGLLGTATACNSEDTNPDNGDTDGDTDGGDTGGGDTSTGDTDGDADSASCSDVLSAFCDTDCPTYAEAASGVEADAGLETEFCFGAEVGTCGDLQYTLWNGGYGGPIQYFDNTGTLVAAWVSTDTNSYCNFESFDIWYGEQQNCELVAVEDFCATP